MRARSSTLTPRTVFTATARQGILRYVKGGRNQPADTAAASVDANGNPLSNAHQAQVFGNGFLDAFNTVKAGGDSPLMDNLLKADTRLNAGETGSQVVRRLYSSNLRLNSVAGLAATLAQRLQGTKSLSQLSAGLPFFFYPTRSTRTV